MSAHQPGPARQALWITRHGNRADAVDPEWRQQAKRPKDPPLSPDGIIQAKELGKRLLDEGISYVFASPFLRAVETAAHAADTLDLPVRIEHGLCEWLNPEWFPSTPDYLCPDEMARQFPGVDTHYRSVVVPTHPETWEEMEVRTGRTAKLLAERFSGDMLLIGHGASVIGICRRLLKSPPEQIRAPLCGLTKIVREGNDWRLELMADTTHLSRPREDLGLR